MHEFKAQIKKWFLLPLIGFLIIFLLIALNQCIQLVNWGFSVHEGVGWLLMGLSAALFLGLFVYPLLSLLRFQSLPDVPKDKESPEYTTYIASLHKIMQNNRFLIQSEVPLPGEDKEAELKKAFSVLDHHSDALIKKEAAEVFLTTAISQNGSLDGLFVLASLIRLVWKIIHTYETRPSLKRILYLYGNVAATVLISRSIEDADLLEDQIEPVISSLLGGSVLTLIPGAVPITTLVVSSVTEGSLNALLTLRCGCIAQRYLSSLTQPERRSLRRSASLEATAKLVEIMRENTFLVIRSFAKAAKHAAAGVTVNRFRRKNTPAPQPADQ